MYTVQDYPEFEQDIKEIWNEFMITNNFEVIKLDEYIELRNEKCSILLALNVEQRIHYFFQNPKTLRITDYDTLGIYFGIHSFINIVGEEEYPLTMDEWIILYAQDDYRSISRVDLPIILDEIKKNFQFIVDGDFSWEKNIDEWKKWRNANRNGVPGQHKELTYKHFLKATEGKVD